LFPLFAIGVVDTGSKFTTYINDTSDISGKFTPSVVDTMQWCTLICKYLCKFAKKIEMTQVLFSGSWGKVIHEKNLKQNILEFCPFNIPVANGGVFTYCTVCFYLLKELLLADLLPDAMMCDFLSQSMLAGGWARTRHMIL
jgi:hypothetical protein